MERNPTDDMGTSGAGTSNLGSSADSLSGSTLGGSSAAGTSGYADTASDANRSGQFGASDSMSGNTSSDTSSNASGGSGIADRLDQARSTATNALSQAKDAASDRLGQAKEKATQLKSTLADRLEQGANSLRQQSQGGQLVGAGADGQASGLMSNDQLQRLAGPAADAMQKTADFLRNGDLRETLEEQVRTNPGRTLLIALGLGYVLGKALRR
jgi:hypothetical protein